MSEVARTRAALAWYALAIVAVVVGVFLRVWQIDAQIPLDDEWHALHKMLASDYADIATHFGYADYSILLTLYDRFLFDHGGLGQWGLYLPMLIAGCGLLVLAPAMLRASLSWPVRATWTTLLALSPMLVYLSRTARPYALTCALVFVALVAFRRWQRRDPHRIAWAVAYAIATVVAAWLHLITLVYTLLPFAYFGVIELSRATSTATRGIALREIGRLLLLGLATALPLVAILLPPFIGDWSSLAGKAATHDAVTFDSVYRTLLMLLGTGHPLVAAIELVLFALGIRQLWRRDRDGVLYFAVVLLLAAIAIALARPTWIQHPGAYARYLLPAVPFVLLAIAEGILALVERVRGEAAQVGFVVAMSVAFFAVGPLPKFEYAPNQFMDHARFQFDYDDAHNPYVTLAPKKSPSPFYRMLAAQPPRSLTIVEAPWRLESNYLPEPWQQRVHRQRVEIGLVSPTCGERAWGEYPESSHLHLAAFTHLSALLRGERGDADFLVVRPRPFTIPAGDAIDWPDMDACLPTIEAALGAPSYRDEQIVVFALSDAGRAALAASKSDLP